MTSTKGFSPPPYPYDRLDELKPLAERHAGGIVDCSIGTPIDPPPRSVVDALALSDSERSYPPSIGTLAFREQIATWFDARLGCDVDAVSEIAAAVGTKEFVAGLPHWMKLRDPDRDTVLFPAVSYPSYEMGATLAGCRAVPVPVNDDWSIQLDAVTDEDKERALLLWVNTPGNPAGGLDDLETVAKWGRSHGIPVFSLYGEVRRPTPAMMGSFDVILIETVGVGQSETDAAEVADAVAFCVQPASGDSLQFMKAGVMEIPDILLVTKADLGAPARRAAADAQGALSLAHRDGPPPPVPLVSAASGAEGVAEALERMLEIAERKVSPHQRHEQAEAHATQTLRERFGAEGLRLAALAASPETRRSNPFSALQIAERRLTEAFDALCGSWSQK